ncbi:hypothetical protein M9H77_26911 [Catharanthus roseus]|uniref:Uncharacterized protein n=1 Tax=Catharanthus roseus TaxID=4058 RepID=A0ACC0AF96_CATRO|nr:hypothetical protein M9H77_26911 [Catharanthus roseus]
MRPLFKTQSCIKIENQSVSATLLYSLTFKEFLDELIFKRELKVLQVFMLNQEFPLLNNVLKLFCKKFRQHFLFHHLPFKEIFWKHDLAKEQVSTSKDFYGIYWWTRSVNLEFHYLELLIQQLRKCFEDSLKWKRERIWCSHLPFEELFWKFGVANEVQNDAKPFNTNSLTSKRSFLANDICDLESLLVKTSWILQYISRILQKHLSRVNEGTSQSVENLSLYYYHPFKETMLKLSIFLIYSLVGKGQRLLLSSFF